MGLPGLVIGFFSGISFLVILGILYNIFKDIPAIVETTSRILSYFYWLGTIPRRKKAKLEIEAKVNKYTQALSKRSCGKTLFPYGLSIDWVKAVKKQDIDIAEGEVILKIKYDPKKSRIFVDTLLLYLSESFIIKGRDIINTSIYLSSKFVVAKEIAILEDENCYKYLRDSYINPTGRTNTDFKEIFDKLSVINENGFFLPVFLRELEAKGELLYGRPVHSSITEEFGLFIDFLYNIADKKHYEEITGSLPPLIFIRSYIKIGLVLVAKYEKTSFDSHYTRVIMNFRDGASIVYVTGFGNNNIKGVESVARRLVQSKVGASLGEPIYFKIGGIFEDPTTSEYYGKETKGVLYGFKKVRRT